MSTVKPTAHLRVESGVVIEMDWPLNEYQQQKFDKGIIWCVDPATGQRVPPPGQSDDDWVPNLVPAEQTAPSVAPEPTPGAVRTRPKDSASKGEWVEWAVYLDQDRELAEALSKADLIEMFGSATGPGTTE